MMNSNSIWNRIALFAMGADEQVLALCPSHEQKRVMIAGTMVLIPAGLGFFSGMCAAAQFTQNQWLIALAGILYATLIFTIDRAIVVLTPNGHFNLAMLLRVTLAIGLSFIITEPIVLSVFNDKIRETEEIKIGLSESNVMKAYKPYIFELQTEISACEEKVQSLEDQYDLEFNGHGSTGKIGVGDIAKELQRRVDVEKTQCEQIRQRNQFVIDSLIHARSDDVQRARHAVAKSLTGRMSTLHDIMEENTIIYWAVWLFRLVLFLMEIIPMTLKFSKHDEFNPDVYGNLARMRTREHLYTTNQLSDTRKRNDLRRQQLTLFDEKIAMEEKILHHLAEDRKIQLAFILERDRAMQKLKEESKSIFDLFENDTHKRSAYHQFVDRMAEHYQQSLFLQYQHFTTEGMTG